MKGRVLKERKTLAATSILDDGEEDQGANLPGEVVG